MENNNQGQKGSNKIWLILFLLSAMLNVYLWMHQGSQITTLETRVDTMSADSVNMEKEISDAKDEIKKYRGISANLDSLLNEANSKIDEQAKKIKSVLGQRDKIKKQLAELQALRDEYLARIADDRTVAEVAQAGGLGHQFAQRGRRPMVQLAAGRIGDQHKRALQALTQQRRTARRSGAGAAGPRAGFQPGGGRRGRRDHRHVRRHRVIALQVQKPHRA